MEETVALIGGGHTVAGILFSAFYLWPNSRGNIEIDRTADRTPNGLDPLRAGPLDSTITKFDNRYFKEIIQSAKPPGVSRIPADLTFANDPEARQWYVIFSQDQQYFFDVFKRAMEKLVDLGAVFETDEQKSQDNGSGRGYRVNGLFDSASQDAPLGSLPAPSIWDSIQ